MTFIAYNNQLILYSFNGYITLCCNIVKFSCFIFKNEVIISHNNMHDNHLKNSEKQDI